MGTKNEPSAFDCYAKAEPDEPMFVLLARDQRAPRLVREWVRIHHLQRTNGYDPERVNLDDKEREALAIADAMDTWRWEHG